MQTDIDNDPIAFKKFIMSSAAWCYQCNAPCELTDDLKCRACNEDFVEYESSISRTERRTPRVRSALQMSFNVGDGMPITINIPFNPVDFGNNMLNPGGSIRQGLVNWIQGILGQRVPGMRPMGDNGQQLGDFFVGTEEQLRMLADRLMQMDSQSLGSPPTDENFVEQLKPVNYKHGDCVEETCSICLDDLEEDKEVIILPCKHGFHPDCINPWLKMHSECPICRHKLPSK